MKAILESIRRRAACCPHEPAVIGSDLSLDYAALQREVESLAERLAAGRGTLGLLADNGPGWVVMDLAAALAGRPLVPLPGFFSAGQLAHAIRDAGIRTLYTDGVVSFSALPPLASHADSCCGRPWRRLDLDVPPRPLPAGCAKITYTSGTTGAPKGVCLDGAAQSRVAVSLRDRTAIAEDDRHLCLLPLATLLENIAGVYLPLLAGATVCVPPLAEVGMEGAAGLDVQRLLAALDRYRASRAILLPHMLQCLVEALQAGAAPPPGRGSTAVASGPRGLWPVGMCLRGGGERPRRPAPGLGGQAPGTCATGIRPRRGDPDRRGRLSGLSGKGRPRSGPALAQW